MAKDFRFVTDPSHHNYSSAIRGLGHYYTLAARGVQKERPRGHRCPGRLLGR